MSHLNQRLGRPALAQGRRRLLASGLALPGPAIDTQSLCQLIQARFDIRTERHAKVLAPRLGVETRHLCRDFINANEAPRAGARNPELAAAALQDALNRAALSVDSLSYLISHTATPSQLLPAGSAEIAQILGYHGPHAELRQACTGFANALQFAFALTAHKDAAPVAIVGVETGSVYFEPNSLEHDASQWINFLQMGDGAAAVIIGPDQEASRDDPYPEPTYWISAAYFGQLQDPPTSGLRLRSGGSDCTKPSTETILFEHDFSGVAEHGTLLLEAGRDILQAAGHTIDSAQMIIPHQASGAVAPWLAQHWQLPLTKFSQHARQVGNLGSASIWAALHAYLMSAPAPDSKAVFLGAEATQYSFGGFVLEN